MNNNKYKGGKIYMHGLELRPWKKMVYLKHFIVANACGHESVSTITQMHLGLNLRQHIITMKHEQ